MRQGGGSYPEGAPIAAPVDAGTGAGFEGFGDCSLSMDGNGSFAAASWVRLSERVPEKDAGDALTAADISQVTASAEIVASVWDGEAWSSTRLSTNTTPDIAPVTAVSGGRALVAWRNVYANDPNNSTDFSAYDTILYSIYTPGSGWSEPAQLYNGSAGAVRGLNAAMLPDGTAAVVRAGARRRRLQ